MNQTFSLTRFGRLLRTYFVDSRGQLLTSIGLLAGGLVVLGALVYQGSPVMVNQQRYLLFFLLGWPCWYVFTVQQTAVLNQKERAITYLMQPASQFEKIALIWLISGLGFIVVYLSAYALMDAAGTSYVNNRDWTPNELIQIRQQAKLFPMKSIFTQESNREFMIPAQLWILTGLLHPFALAFSLIVRRYTLPLVVVIAFALLIFGYIGNNVLLNALTGSATISSMAPFADARAQSPTGQSFYRAIDLPQPFSNQFRYAVGVVVVVLLYVTAYFRLKEREV